jgi:hypothetical protein
MPVSADPTGLAWVGLGLRPLPVLRIALRIGVFVTPRTRAYLVRGSPLFETQAVAPYADLVFEVPLDGGRVDSP